MSNKLLNLAKIVYQFRTENLIKEYKQHYLGVNAKKNSLVLLRFNQLDRRPSYAFLELSAHEKQMIYKTMYELQLNQTHYVEYSDHTNQGSEDGCTFYFHCENISMQPSFESKMKNNFYSPYRLNRDAKFISEEFDKDQQNYKCLPNDCETEEEDQRIYEKSQYAY